MDQSDGPPPDSSVHKPVPVLDAASLASVIAEEPLLSAHGGSTRMDVANISADQIMLAFKDLSVSAGDTHLLTAVTGFVLKGGVTAVLGPSSAGKSVLMQVLCGRAPSLRCTGDVTLNGRAIDPHSQRNGFAYTFEVDLLIGDITVRETLEIAANLRRGASPADNAAAAEAIIQEIGIGRVSNNVIGTVLKRGLPGGEKKRVTIGQELVVQPVIALLDSPTSGLDSTAAYDVIKTIKTHANASEGKFSVMLSIHQPDMRLLSLFDHILLLGDGGSLFFGTLSEALQHLAALGYPVPHNTNPADHFLAVTDTAFAPAQYSSSGVCGSDCNFRQEYATSAQAQQVKAKLQEAAVLSQHMIKYDDDSFGKGSGSSSSGSTFKTSFWRQFWTLTKRDAILAVRDPTLYYLQVALHVMYGLIVGLAFYKLDTVLDDTISYLPGSVVWCLMLNGYVHVFKVFYLVTSNKRFTHERANGSYSVLAYFCSELLVTAMSHLLLFPGVAIAFWMVGFPAKAFGFYMLVQYATAQTAEASLSLISKLTDNAAYAVVACQAFLVMITVFAGGLFIPFTAIPSYWSWLAELGVFTHSTKAALLYIFKELVYTCPQSPEVSADGLSGVCVTVQGRFSCNAAYDAATGLCTTEGLSVIALNNGVTGNAWTYFGYLVLLCVCLRLAILLLCYYPLATITKAIKNLTTSKLHQVALETTMEVMRLRGEVNALKKLTSANTATNSKSSSIAMTSFATGYTASGASYAPVDVVGTEPDDQFDDDEHDDIETGVLVHTLSSAHKGSERHQRLSSFRRTSNVSAVYLTFSDVTVSLPAKTRGSTGKVLIDSITAHAVSGRVLALMGPSGAGKTTLLNALSGRAVYAKVEGSVKLGNRTLTADDLDYVPQFDDLNEFFTVRELLLYHAMLKTKGDMVKKRVAELIHILGLLSKADVRVNELSHGEKKRVSIGIGLVGEATVLYLDEPTTGLDSAAAHTVVEYITQVAQKTGVIVVMTIHQPSGQVFNMLQDLMLLESGRLAYFGPRTAALHHFTALGADAAALARHSNLSTVYLDLISAPPVLSEQYRQQQKGGASATTVVTWSTLYSASAYRVRPPAVGASGAHTDAEIIDRPNNVTRTAIMLKSMSTYYWRNTTVYWLRLLEMVIVAAYVGTIFVRMSTTTGNIGKIVGASFFNTWCALFAVIAAAPAFVVERRTALQEMLNGAYGGHMFCFVQFCASLPFTVVTSIVFQAIFHYSTGLNSSFESYVYVVCLTVALLLMMEAMMLMVVEVLKDAMMCTTFSMVLLGTQFLFPGFFIKTTDLVPLVRWCSYIMPTRYSFNGYLYAVFHGQDYKVSGDATGASLSGDQILQGPFKQSSSENMWANLGAVLGYVILFRLGHYALVMYNILPYTKKTITSSSAAATAAVTDTKTA